MRPMKTCTSCRQSLPPGAFRRNRTRPDGREARCRACKRAHESANRERIRAYQATYRESHREEIRARQAAYRERIRSQRQAG
jgi:hypothetical protein